MSKKIMTVVGARPQFVKAAMLSRAIQQHSQFTEVLVHTGQHYDPQLSEVFFTELQMKMPNYHLNIGSGAHGQQTGAMLAAIEEIIIKEKPDWLVVYGDTNSTLAGALAAAKLQVPVAHIEAGLRSFNRAMPEEVNRVLTDHIASLCFAPTEMACTHLHHEGIDADKIILSGDIMYDAALYYAARAQERATALNAYALKSKDYVLATIHRAENTDHPEKLRAILTALNEFSQQHLVVLPMHPRTQKIIAQQQLQSLCEHIKIIPPLSFFDMILLEKNAKLIATDSGGVQKEAYFYQVPCATLRTETEWVELISAGWNILVPPTNSTAILDGLTAALGLSGSTDNALYGEGHAAELIVKYL